MERLTGSPRRASSEGGVGALETASFAGAGEAKGEGAAPPAGAPGELLRVHIHHAPTSVCLFDRAWQWRTECQSDVISSLVQSFHQFAREIDDGGTSGRLMQSP